MARKMINAEEYDCYTGWRRMLCWTQRPRAVKSVKKRTHRRERREGKDAIREQLD